MRSSLGPLGILARVALLGLIAALLVRGGAASAAAAPVITRPAPDSRYSLGLQDADPAPGFHVRVEGSSEAAKVVEVFAKRSGGQSAKVGEGTADAQGK